MAEHHSTSVHPASELITQSIFAQSPAAAGLDLSSEIIVRTPFPDIAEYQGTRAAIEAEEVIPSGTKWPNGFDDLHWQDDKFCYSLRRLRPEGIKGPRKQFLDVDWWRFRFSPLNANPIGIREIERKTKELGEYIRRQSVEGKKEATRQFKCYLDARKDEKFQAFKAGIHGIIQPERRRHTKSAKQSKTE